MGEMAIPMFAAIYIGSYEVSLKICELSSKKKIHEVDYVRSRLDLGRDVYQNGTIGYERVDELCEILNAFSGIMREYKVTEHEIYASGVLRDAQNQLFVVHQVYLRTGFKIKVISNSEYRFIGYKSIAAREPFEKMIHTSAAVVDIGGSGIQITTFREGKIETTQHLEIGTVRLRELLSDRGQALTMYETQIEEYVNKKLEVFRSLYLDAGIDYVIFMSDYCEELVAHLDKNQSDKIVKAERFLKYIDKLLKKNVEEICQELNLANSSDPLIVPSMIVFKSMVNNLNASNVWVPGVNISDGIAYDHAERNHMVKSTHDFEGDIISAAQNLSRHYNSYSPHIKALTKLSTKIFDTMKKVHGMGNRERLLLQVAVILHDCGKYISLANSPKCAYEIIMASEIIGLSHLEREMVAMTVLYNTLPLDDYEEVSDRLDQQSYLIVAKLSAILRVANALDQSHKQKFQDIRISLKDRNLVITVESLEDISLEQALFEAKTTYFENVFSMKPVLKEKRVYNYH
jgi:exopolyphosphatase/guanosine-5'-triphosphate,3'-diphosphate pyrophosphatase